MIARLFLSLFLSLSLSQISVQPHTSFLSLTAQPPVHQYTKTDT
jgi:hypothetical protein